MRTSGEVRVFVERRCSWIDAIDRAAELFHMLGMDRTAARNGVLVYVALKDRQLAVYGDEGIHRKVGTEYWNQAVREMLEQFNHAHYAGGIAGCVHKVGAALQQHFPYDRHSDTNELSDEIVYGG
ncbi:MAG: hypothetical protein RJA57_928 [Bacteroidota bacterium]